MCLRIERQGGGWNERGSTSLSRGGDLSRPDRTRCRQRVLSWIPPHPFALQQNNEHDISRIPLCVRLCETKANPQHDSGSSCSHMTQTYMENWASKKVSLPVKMKLRAYLELFILAHNRDPVYSCHLIVKARVSDESVRSLAGTFVYFCGNEKEHFFTGTNTYS